MTCLEEIGPFAEVPIDVDVELDRKTLSIRQILELDTGNVFRMNRSAGENVDIMVGGRVIGYGEIVIIEDIMGVRITDFKHED
ncbi:MAG: hypothetical protein FJW40_00480 [Acidobacteria bacterium]|nr:hypothetical protein [Acidobacteriota bacterium]